MSDRMAVSWSRLRDYEMCHHLVHKKMQGADRGSIKDGRVFLAGTVCDRTMRRLLEHDEPRPGMMLEWLPEILDHYAFHDDEYVIRWKRDRAADFVSIRDKCVRVLERLEPILFERVVPLGYQAEVKFRVTVGVPYLDGHTVPVDMIGGMDILTKDLRDGSYGVHDLKSTENDTYVSKTLGQLIFYAIAARSMFGVFPERLSFLTPACREREVPVHLTPSDVRVMLSRIESYCHGVWRNDWRPKETVDSGCMYDCTVRHACDLFALPPGGGLSFEEMAERRRRARGAGGSGGGVADQGTSGAGGGGAA